MSIVHPHNLKIQDKTNVPKPSTEIGKRNYEYRGSVLLNSLPLIPFLSTLLNHASYFL